MHAYRYSLRDAGGRLTAGVLRAATLADATALVRAQGSAVLVAPLAAGLQGLLERVQCFRVDFGPSLSDILSFTTQLAVMIKAGISIRDAIDGIARQVTNPKFRGILAHIKLDVESGQPFSAALVKHPRTFSPLYINMVKASELSGSFGSMLDRIAAYLAQQLETRSMVRGAMVYPAIIATMAIGTTIFLLTWVLPKFTALFAGKERLLPLPTVMLLAISAFLRTYWWGVLGAAGLAFTALVYAVRTPRGRVCWDLAKLRLPLFKRMFRAMYITRGLQTMGELVNAGVPMLETLAITAAVSGNTLHRRMWGAVHKAVEQGDKIAHPLARQNLLPANVVQMISAGEESGKLADVMRDIAEFYSRELRNTIKAVTAVIEPLMIVLMGVLVGFIAMSIILPIFKMSSLLK